MATNKHTPGPWRAVKDYARQRAWNVERAQHERDATGLSETVDPVASVVSFGAVEADARLIAAAPDLLAALEGLLNDEHALSPVWRQSIDDARAAIARAKGETK